ncbi:MAG TPA: UTP--glucose-1-phosphate uridylyltransferase GalU [Candidatus Methylomirabilis sp.]|nr:UTP--glucose-1-phosphate uridylyltransferase GalU [Candidatus Methylomirabilis sp.]HSC69760.1 UTP--glucose-1-phosphate uridylyltransferase GalU [Candidatus Methylomirabilis sp.]
MSHQPSGISHQRVRKAVIPAAGMGTRFLPATKSMPKEMLPIVDKPVLQFVIEEAVASGIDDILIITGRGKRAIENHFDFNPELEAFLASVGKLDLIEQVRDIGEQAQIHYIRQKQQLGLGDAIRLGRDHVGNQPFAVLLGDTIIDPPEGQKPGLQQLLDVYEGKRASVVAVHRVPREWVTRYGIVGGETEPDDHDLVRLRLLVEKPGVAEAPSDLAIAGRYVFTPEIFQCIEATGRGVGGEIQLTDAMNLLAQRQPMYALAWQAKRYDIGNRVEYAKCFIDFALRRPETAKAVRDHLWQLLKDR